MAQKSLIHYLLHTRELYGKSQDGAADGAHSPAPVSSLPLAPGSPSDHSCEYSASVSKADLDASLEAMYTKLAVNLQTELHKTSHTLSQEIAALGTRIDRP